MAKSSINFIQVKNIQYALKHNDRSAPPEEYFLPAEYHEGNEVLNDSKTALELINELYAQSKKNYRREFGQKLQAKSYLWEAEVNLNEHHGLSDVEKLAQAIEEETGFKAVQIAVHKDEGRVETDKNGNEFPIHNYHAHIIFFTLDPETGEQLYRRRVTKRQKKKRPDLKPMNKERMSKLQDITAEVLDMQRGKKGSKAVRYTPAAYREKKEYEKKLKKLKEEITELKEEVAELKNLLEDKHIDWEYEAHNVTVMEEIEESYRIWLQRHDILDEFDVWCWEGDGYKEGKKKYAERKAQEEAEKEKEKSEEIENHTDDHFNSPELSPYAP